MKGVVEPTTDTRAHRVLADASRVAVLEALRHADRPLAVSDLAEAVGLHPNTVRAHLALLTEYGYARGRAEERSRPGRPRLLYTAVARRQDGGRDGGGYRMLAEALTAYRTESAGPVEAAARAGRAHGRRLVRSGARGDGPSAGSGGAPGTGGTGRDATEVVVRMLDDAGFDPRLDGDRVLLRACPFRELAESDPTVVCGVHLGLMQGAFAELGAPVEVDRLEPFVRPRLCVATLRRRRSARQGTARRTGEQP
jgi:predicted ArsR family transcriptional regulator